MKKYNVKALDGDLGKVKDIYFDDQSWTVRYLVVDTKKWLPGRKVLISPLSMDEVDHENEVVHIQETKKKIKDSPEVDEAEPVSKRHEILISDYFDWPYYWTNIGLWGSYETPRALIRAYDDNGEIQSSLEKDVETKYHLRSMNEIQGEFSGYQINATNGDIGRVVDFLIDDDMWKAKYLIVETGKWLPGKLVIISPDWIENVDWFNKKVSVDLTKEQIKNGPEYSFYTPLTREFEEKVYDSYGKEKYWKEYSRFY